jgi:hypothetical protein
VRATRLYTHVLGKGAMGVKSLWIDQFATFRTAGSIRASPRIPVFPLFRESLSAAILSAP